MNNECDKITALISDYIDGGLDSSSHTLVDEHIALCDRCRRELELTKRLVTQLAGLKGNRVGCDLWPEVAGRIAEMEQKRRSWKRFLPVFSWKVAVPTAAVAAGLLFAAIGPVHKHVHKPDVTSTTQHQQVSEEYKAYLQAYTRFRSAQTLTDRGVINAVAQLHKRDAVSN